MTNSGSTRSRIGGLYVWNMDVTDGFDKSTAGALRRNIGGETAERLIATLPPDPEPGERRAKRTASTD